MVARLGSRGDGLTAGLCGRDRDRRLGHVRHAPAVPAGEAKRAVTAALHGEAILVDEAVVKATQQDEVVGAGRAAVGPVFDVVGVQVVAALTARIAAVAIATLE